MNYLILIIVAVVGFIIGRGSVGGKVLTQKSALKAENGVGETQTKSSVVLSEQAEERKEKILQLIAEKGRITNDDIEKLLGVADSTATKYLQQLEDQGQIKQQGATGRFVYYEKI